MGFQIMADLIGHVDSRADTFFESVYLLREDFCVIGMRRERHARGHKLRIGDNFFQCYPASEKELRTLKGMTGYANEHSLLMRAGNSPVLILFALFARTRLLVAVVPKAPVRAHLDTPASYASLLQESHLFLSPESASRHTELTEEGYRIIHPWVQRIQQTLFYNRIHHLESDAALLNAIMRLRRIADLCDCAIDYDFTAIEHIAKRQDDFDLMTSSLFALLLAVHRVSPDRYAKLVAAPVYGSGPMVGAVFSCNEPIDTLTELQHLAKEAQIRGERFDVALHPDDPTRVMVQFALCHKELSEQGIKRPTPDCFCKEGKNFLPYSIPASEDFKS